MKTRPCRNINNYHDICLPRERRRGVWEKERVWVREMGEIIKARVRQIKRERERERRLEWQWEKERETGRDRDVKRKWHTKENKIKVTQTKVLSRTHKITHTRAAVMLSRYGNCLISLSLCLIEAHQHWLTHACCHGNKFYARICTPACITTWISGYKRITATAHSHTHTHFFFLIFAQTPLLVDKHTSL